MRYLLILALAIVTMGCDNHYDKLLSTKGIDNLRKEPNGYLMYTIEEGKVTCREHKARAELACWGTVDYD